MTKPKTAPAQVMPERQVQRWEIVLPGYHKQQGLS